MATINGAKAVGSSIIGKLEKGMQADITFLDMDSINLFPLIKPISNIVYSGRGSDVIATMVNGEFTYYFGKYPRINEGDIRNQFMEKYVKLYE